MVMGVPILRDFDHKMESLMFVNPIKKKDYLLGRFLGSFVILILIYSSIVPGIMIGEIMPWSSPEKLLAFNLMTYIRPFLNIVLPILFFGSALFFVSGTLSRKMMVVYTQGIFIFLIFMVTRGIENDFISAVLDPFSFNSLSDVTRDLSPEQINNFQIPFSGVFLYNKIFWVLIGILILAFGYFRFNFNVIRGKSGKNKKSIDVAVNNNSYTIKTPKFSINNGFAAQLTQLLQGSLFYFKSILKEVSFWAIVGSGMLIIIINSVSLGTVYDVDSFPTTTLIIAELQEMSGFFFIIILIFYSGEIIWKEKSVKLNLIHDSLPISEFVNLLSKLIGLILIYIVLMVSLVLSGIMFQTVSGYYNYELDVYFYGFFVELLPLLVIFTILSFFFQIVSNNKFIGYILVMVSFILAIILPVLGISHGLLSFGGGELTAYSAMNGYGHFLEPYLWYKAYWLTFGAIIFAVTVLFTVRGTETGLKNRFKLFKQRLKGRLMTFIGLSFAIFISIGSYIYYNTNVLNKYWESSEKTEFRVGYEKSLKKFEYIAQPKIIGVNLNVDLYPETRDYIAKGEYILTNIYKKDIKEIHVHKMVETQLSLDNVSFTGGATADNQYDKYSYTIYTLNNALKPGDSITMSFEQVFTTDGFEDSGSSTSIVNNGTFFSNKDFPSFGYSKKYELTDKDDRAEFGFADRKNKAKIDDEIELTNGKSGSDADKISFEITIGTSADQTAIAPGNLVRQWKEGGRNYFHYKMDQKMINFYSIVSARYEVKTDKWVSKSDSSSKTVDLEIYYNNGHEYNIDCMMESMKASFDYFTTNFGAYQYKQMRIMEFPSYASFAQSFPGTVPFSESIGFILDINDDEDVDMAFYITAHELAHQWWGMQVVAANVQGKNMVLESLAQYSALMVLKSRYSEEKVQQFLDNQLKMYKKGLQLETKEELPMCLVENQEYIYYRKGAVNMYIFQEIIGEDKVNLALKRFVKDWNAFDPSNTKGRYATSNDLLEYFREVTPEDLQHVVTDLFEKPGEYIRDTE